MEMREANPLEQEHHLLVDFANSVELTREPRFAKARCHGVGPTIGEFSKPDADCRRLRDCRCERCDALRHRLPIAGGNDVIGIDDTGEIGGMGHAMPV